MCLYPRLVPNPKYKINKKNGGNVPPVTDERVKYVPVGCQKCIECKKKKAREWQVRLSEDIKEHQNGKFITLTFNDKSILDIKKAIHNDCIEKRTTIPTDYELDNAIAKYAIRHWLENYRKEHKKSIRHWLVTELGHNGTENIHIHGIVWIDDINKAAAKWKYGYVWKGKEKNGRIENYVNGMTVSYIVKYVNKTDEKHPLYESKIFTSAGIGSRYTKLDKGDWNRNKYNEKGETNEAYRSAQGHKMTLPVYYRNKIYSEEEREKLWIEKLNKNVRWVMGQKISIAKGEEEYYSALKDAQKTNRELGYNGEPVTWEQEQYERQRRYLKQNERVRKARTEEAYKPIHKPKR